MDSLPTIDECSTWILERCQTILNFIEKGNFDIKEIAQTTFDNTKILINALDINKREKIKLYNKLERYSKFKQNNNMLKLLILNIKEICCQVICQQEQQQLQLQNNNTSFYREKSRILLSSNSNNNNSCKTDYNSIWPDQIDEKACWFRSHFVGKPYFTFIGPIMDNENDLAVISIINEVKEDSKKYRIIVRTKQDMNMGFIVNESDAKELIIQLDESSLGHQQHNKLDLFDTTTAKTTTNRQNNNNNKPSRSFSSAIIIGMTTNQQFQQQQSTRIMRAAILFLFQDLNFKLFKELSAETTILSGLEKEFLRYDEIGIPKCYKFGVLTIKDGQNTEEEWFSNSGLSIGLKKLLNIIGKPIELKGYKGYAAGLDTKTGESGEISYISSWRDHEIMLHVAPLMPSREYDIQQVHRKRYIGNDIVCIVFMEGGKFDPNSIRSQFLHVFIIVHLEVIHNQDTWRIEVLYNTDVKPFLPLIPSPPVFYNSNDLKQFLILKLINAENSALKSDKFTLPNNKARLSILKTLVETGLEASQNIHLYYNSNKNKKNHHGSGKGGEGRPKSAGATVQQTQRYNNNSVFVVEPTTQRSLTPELPPIPSISKSNVLRDLKSITRRKSGGGGQQHHASTSSQPQRAIANIGKEDEVVDNKRGNVERSPPPIPVATATTIITGSGIRYKAHNLMNTMIGRKNSRTSIPHRHSSS